MRRRLQACVAGLLHVLGSSIHADRASAGVADDSEFRGENDFVAASGNRAADELFIASEAVDIGGVEQGDAAIDGGMNRGDGFGFVRRAVEFGHAHAAQARSRKRRESSCRAGGMRIGFFS